MMVVVFNDALAAYISRVLPSLGVEGVRVVTYGNWAGEQRRRHLPRMPKHYSEDTPPSVTRLKKHPALLTLVDERVAREREEILGRIRSAVAGTAGAEQVERAIKGLASFTVSQQVTGLGQWVHGEREINGSRGNALPTDTRMKLSAVLDRVRARSREVAWDWAELITDTATLREGFARLAPGAFTDMEIAQAVRWNTALVGRVLVDRPEETESEAEAPETERRWRTDDERDEAMEEHPPARARTRNGDGDEDDEGEDVDPYRAIDGIDESSQEPPALDHEDDALLLRLYQRKRGPLRRDRKTALLYEHIFVDEAQDLSPVEMAVLLDCVTPARSVTLAGDTAQRLLLDNGFTDWQGVLHDLGYRGVAVEPLKIGYRSTSEVLEFARAVLGPLADPEPPVATRAGAPVELHRFPDVGAAVAFLGEALRTLALDEPRASIAVVAREPERADLYYVGLRRAEVPRLSRVRAQDFSFKAGVEVTDIRQVKGLEFDYVVLVDVTASAYPVNEESRHLLHIGATRAAHQLWLIAAAEPSRLLPDSMRD
jgi:DNA helicase-2/ATP-dependent DNA helicase PcrA